MSGTYTSDEKVEYALKTALFRTMQSKDQPSSVEKSAPPRIFPKNIMKKNLIEKGEGDIDENGYYVGGTGSAYGSNDLANLEEPELTITNYRIIDPTSNVITDKRVSDLTTVNMSQTSHNSINALPTTGTNYPLKSWFFRGHYGSHSGEAAFNAANSSYDGLQLAWDKSTVGNTATEADIVPHLKFYLQVQTEYTNVAHGDNISYGHDLMKGLIGLDQNFSTTIQVVQGQGGSCVTLGETGTSTGDFWFTQATAGILSFYGVTTKVNANNGLSNLATTKFPMISFIRYTGETGFGAGSGGGASVELVSADPNVTNMIGGTAQTMTTTSFEFDGNVNITGDLSVTGSGAGTFKGVQSDSDNNILISGNESWNGNTTGLYNTTLGWAAGYQMTSGKENTLIGMNAGINMTTGEKNTLIGNFAGKSLSTGHSNECLGYKAGYSISTGVYNVFIGKEAGTTCTASQNVVIGHQAGYSGTSRSNCVFVGNQAGYDWNSNNQVGIGYRAIHHKKGDKNVAVGYNCMGDSSPDGIYAEMNTAIGAEALHKLNGNASSYGSYNVAVGHRAGYALTTASKNILIGDQAGAVLTTSWGNIIIGYGNGYQLKSGSGSNVLIGLNNIVASGNSTAYYCNCIGYNAGRTLSSGYKNDLFGFNCGYTISSGHNNCGYGAECLRQCTTGDYNSCFGSYSGYNITTSGHNTFIGAQAGYTHKTGDSNVCIGHNAGYYDETCARSIFIGRHAGCASNKGTGTGYGEGGKNDQLFINSYMSGDTYTGTNQFIYGYMKMDDKPWLKFNNNLLIGAYNGSPMAPLHIEAMTDNNVGGDCAFLIRKNYNDWGITINCANSGGSFGYGDYGIDINGTGNYAFRIKQANSEKIRMGFDGKIYTAGNVGIGTTSPANKLEIHGGPLGLKMGNHTATTAQQILFGFSGVANLEYAHSIRTRHQGQSSGVDTDNSIDFYLWKKGDTTTTIGEKHGMSITAAGVGIGTTSPKCVLNVANSMTNDAANNVIPTGSTAMNKTTSLWLGKGVDGATQNYFGLMMGTIYNGPSYIHNVHSDGITHYDLLLQPLGGNVGIGTTSPDHKLDFGNSGGNIRIGGIAEAATDNGSTVGIGKYYSSSGAGSDLYGGIKFEAVGDDDELSFHTHHSGVTVGERMRIDKDGNVGIGTTSPSYPLHVHSTVGASNFTYYGYLNNAGTWSSSSGATHNGVGTTWGTSWGIYCNEAIAAEEAFYVVSDSRIKENIVDVPDHLALQMVRDIPCKYYEYKDKKRGLDKTIGFIAQEVYEVLPMAVSIKTGIIPNEYRVLNNISWNGNKLTTDLQDVSGIKYRFFVSNDPSGNNEYEKEVVGNSDNTFTFDTSYNNVFCYGKEVDDFHTISKEKIFALNFSATQELDKKVIALENENAELKAELAAIKQHLGI